MPGRPSSTSLRRPEFPSGFAIQEARPSPPAAASWPQAATTARGCYESVAAPRRRRSHPAMKHLSKVLALVLALSLAAPRAAQAHDDTGLVIFDIFLNVLALGIQAAALEEHHAAPPASYEQRTDEDWPPPRWAPPRVTHPK